MDRITLWGYGGGVRILQTHHGCKVLLDAFHSAHGQPAYVPSAGANRLQSVPTLPTVTGSHLQVPAHTALKYPPQRLHHFMWRVQICIHTLPGMHICPAEDLCACSALFCFYLP